MRTPSLSRRMRYHTTDANTIALWNGFGNKNDSSGAARHLSLASGTERYAEVGHGLQGFALDGVTWYSRPSNEAAFNLVGDMTIEAIVRVHSASALGYVVAYGIAGETDNDNYLWSMISSPATQDGLPAMTSAGLMTFFWETGSGTDQIKTETVLMPLNEPRHLAWVRTGTTLIPYIDGFAQTSITGITNGTLGGTPAQRLWLGANDAGGNALTGVIASVKISNVARSADYIFKDAVQCLGIGAGLLDMSGT